MKINLKLLKRLYLIDHTSEQEHVMISFILNYCYKIPHLTFEIDEERNIFITKNTTNPDTYACVVAHLDGVNDFYTNRELVINNNIISARYISSKIQCGLNADDANGICCALQLLETLPNLKVLFTTQEEIGGIGAKKACENLIFFDDVRYCLQADRHGAHDLIYFTNGIRTAPDIFIKDIQPVMDKYFYKLNTGTFTDIGVIANKLQIAGVNISCGYYHEHFTNEICDVVELNNCLNFMYEVITSLDSSETFYSTPVQQKSEAPQSMWDDSPKEYDFTYGEPIPCETCSNQDCMNCKAFNEFHY